MGRTSKMNVFVASSACWTIADELVEFVRGARRLALEEALNDLSLKRDIGDALRGSVVHLARDLATHLLLSGEDVA